MSAKIFGLVWELELPREEKYVLLCLADHADHDGNNVYPSIGLIAWKTDYSERRIQELMRRLQHKGLLVKVEEQIGRGHTVKYRIDLQAGTFKERRTKGAKISPIPQPNDFIKGEIPQGQKGAAGRVKGELATAPESIEPKTWNLFPPTPQRGVPDIWQQVSAFLKDDLSTGYVNNGRFQTNDYEKYFRDAWLVEIKGGIAILDSPEPNLLCDGVEKFQRRLRDTFRAVVSEVYSIKVAKSPALADAS
jgi:Helix-turn-helix domain